MSGRLFITGDTHGQLDINKMTTRRFPIQKELDKDDIVVVLGDFGVCFYGDGQDRYIQNWWNDKKFTTIAAAGNHEAFPLISGLPTVEKYNGTLHQVADSVYYAANGTVLNLGGRKCLFINGADSHDRELRTEGVSWWPQEFLWTKASIGAALFYLDFCQDIDYVFTHTGGSAAASFLGFTPTYTDFLLDQVLNKLNEKGINYRHYCAHYHKDIIVNDKTRIMYNDIIELP